MEIVGTSRQGTSSGNGDASIDMVGLVKFIREKLDKLSCPSPECCIYEVPKTLKKINEDAYTPRTVSIGPLHHGKAGLKHMEEHKLRYFNDFMQRSGKSLEELVQIMEEMEKRIGECYAETINLKSEIFLKIILVDAAFIIEVLLRSYSYLEVQELLVPEHIDPSEIKHILDFLRICLIPKQSLQPSRQSSQQNERKFDRPSATELHEAGVEFKVSSSKNLFDIKFSGNILEIPHTRIVDSTERLLRNIIAYEQCHYDVTFFGAYTLIMDYLINTSKDVELLVQAKIIENWLSDNSDVSNLFNGLSKEVNVKIEEYYFTKLHEELNDYCEIRSHKWKATLRQDYCNTPWRVLSITVAAILLGLTFIQSLCSLVSCNK
ncbi:UPF0481 protein [Camellia lanceoleosa]|uniref:UPF0481 protein n=1 Tax=Camellia lanceoleosa TaxID=1840588 RepID=A0ACC0G5I4_9ERIC|nr:UPF0481 protein [Camellia lanceoleosa]